MTYNIVESRTLYWQSRSTYRLYNFLKDDFKSFFTYPCSGWSVRRLCARKPVKPHLLGDCCYSADRPKSVRNCCVIDVFYVVTLLFGLFSECRGFWYRTESDLFPFLFERQKRSTEGCSKFKFRKHDKLRWKWSTLEQMQVQNGTGPGVWSSKRPLLSVVPVAMFYEILRNLVIGSKLVIRSRSVLRSQIGLMSEHLRVSLYMAMSQNVMLHLGEGDFMFNDIPISTLKLPEGRFHTFPDISLLLKCIHHF